jgi:alcohol dehydrogenase class IV
MAGMAFSSAGLGLCHAISHALGGEFHLAHGRLNAMLLPAVMDCNADKALHRYAQLSHRLGCSTGADPVAFRALKNTLLRLRRELSLPETLAQAGIPAGLVREKMETLVSAALADPCCGTNPVKPEAHHVRQILHSILGHG